MLKISSKSIWSQSFPAKPMALPSGAVYTGDPESYDRPGPGYNKIDNIMTTPEAKNEEDLYPEMQYSGAGDYGLAAEIGNNQVVKYSTDRKEVEVCRNLKDNPNPCIVRIYDVRAIDPMKPLYAIVMEKVQPISDLYEQVIIDALLLNKYELVTNAPDELFIEDVVEYFLREHNTDLNLNKYQSRILELIKHYRSLLKCLQHSNFKISDSHVDNIGWNSEGRLVRFDMGKTT